jgi:hypothetical protein
MPVIFKLMPIIRLIFLGLALLILHVAASATEEVEIDKARVFPVQKNTTVIHGANKDVADAGSEHASSSADTQKSPPKDTSLQINGNGGSTNRSAGGTATLRKRFTFD